MVHQTHLTKKMFFSTSAILFPGSLD